MAQFNLDDYVSVNTRLEKFWEKYPDGRIDTQIIKWMAGVITMKASVYKNIADEKPAATGHAYEKEGASFINKTSAVENCETSVVGRALALMGFEVKHSIASKEEVANAIHQQEQKTKQDPDAQLKKDLVKKHKGDKVKAKAEYMTIKAKEKAKPKDEIKDEPKDEPKDKPKEPDEFDKDMSNYIEEKFEMENGSVENVSV